MIKKSILCIFILALKLLSADLFFDSFATQNSVLNWKKVTAENCTLNVVNSLLYVNNTNCENYSAIAFHAVKQPLRSYLFSAKVISTELGNGLFFNAFESDTGFSGYGFLVGDKSLYLCKYWPDSVKTLFSFPSSFVRPDTNILTVCRNNSNFLLFCNGYYQRSFSDSEFTKNSIGLIVAPSGQSRFDDAELSDRILDSTDFVAFKDSFNREERFGWTKRGYGVVSVDTVMNFKTVGKQALYKMLDIPLVAFHMSVICSYRKGSIDKSYGLCVAEKNGTEVSTQYLHFGISGEKKYCISNDIYGKAVISSSAILANTTQIRGADTLYSWDTLELVKKKNVDSLTFYVNKTQIGNTYIGDGQIYSAGFFSSESLLVCFDNFALQPQDEPVAVINNYTKVQLNKEIRSLRQVECNLLGRIQNKTGINTRWTRQVLIERVQFGKLLENKKRINGIGK